MASKRRRLSAAHRRAISEGLQRSKFKKTKKQKVKGVWFEGRRTSIVVDASSRREAVEKAQAKRKRGGTKVAGVRNLTPAELKQAEKGRWVRSGYHHQKPGYGELRGYGPASKKYLAETKTKRAS